MTPAQEAWAIGKISAAIEEVMIEIGPTPEGFARLLEIFGKSIVAIADNPQEALRGLLTVIHSPDSADAIDKLGFQRKQP